MAKDIEHQNGFSISEEDMNFDLDDIPERMLIMLRRYTFYNLSLL